jgi:hypothetical protein
MPTSSATDILLATAKDLTAALQQTQGNPLLPPPDTQTRQALIQLNDIFSNVTKPEVNKNVALPRVPNVTLPNHAALPRVPPTTTTEYLTMTATNRRLRRQNQQPSKASSPSPPLSPHNLLNQKIRFSRFQNGRQIFHPTDGCEDMLASVGDKISSIFIFIIT